jgi:putative two-component system response regulator
MAELPTNSKRILIVDDDQTTRTITEAVVASHGYEFETAGDGVEALAKVGLGIDLVLLDVVMPGIDGFEVCRRLRSGSVANDIPVMMLTSMTERDHRLKAVEAGANDFIAKPIDATEFRIRAASLLKLKDAQDSLKSYQKHLEELVRQRTTSLRAALDQMAEAQRITYLAHLDTVERLAIVAEYKDRVTARHIERMSRYCGVIARGLRLPPGEVELVQHASRMHDLGKIAVPDLILGKPSALDQREWKVMREHAAIGANILSNSTSQLLQAGEVIALSHHERWNGSGYPAGLAGEEIPLWGRICAVADTFDAVTSERPYKPAYSNDVARKILVDGRGIQYDPRVVDVFIEYYNEIVTIQEKYADPPRPAPDAVSP